jgi:predicted nucleic acid-binding protein
VYLLDSNILNLYLAGDTNTVTRVNENLVNVWVSSVVAEEWLVARMNSLNRARSPRTSLSLPRAHEDFVQALEDLRIFPIFLYSNEAEAIFQTFTSAQIRVGAQDCRIAAQAMAHKMVVITRNLSDFEAIGAHCEDWSIL